MKQLKILALSFVALIFTACPMDYVNGFRFSNNSNTDVYIYLNAYDGTRYPDTAVTSLRRGHLFKQGTKRSYEYGSSENDPWVDTLCLFIFDADTFNAYSWEEIQDGYKVLQRYDLSPENLKILKRQITYPPTEAMKTMKMYPPYGSE
jgi:hypothetical protein